MKDNIYPLNHYPLYGFLNMFDDSDRKYVMSKLNIAIGNHITWKDILSYSKTREKIFSGMHPEWIFENLKTLTKKELAVAIKSLPTKYLENLSKKYKIPSLPEMHPIIKNMIFNILVEPFIRAPTLFNGVSSIEKENLEPLLFIPSNSINDLIYSLGLKDVANSLRSSVDALQKRMVFSAIDKRFTDIFNMYIRQRDIHATSSITLKQLIHQIKSTQGISATIYSYGITRLALALHSANKRVVNTFYKICGPSITAALLDAQQEEVSQFKRSYFIKGLMNALYFITNKSKISDLSKPNHSE